MIAEIITIGLEITSGSILNTNAHYLAGQLLEMGVEVHYHTSVDDDPLRLKHVLDIALSRADLIITTGGLGPTADDLTKEIVSQSLNLKLVSDLQMEKSIKDKFTVNKRPMPITNLKQALLPEGAIFLDNEIGTAPGIFIPRDKKMIALLPGPPREMSAMFVNQLVDLIERETIIIKRSVNLIDIGESEVEFRIKDLINKNPNLIIATFPQLDNVEIKIIGKGKDREYIEGQINNILTIIRERFHDNVYAYDNITMEEIIFNLLKEKQYKIGFCESCTGGAISGRFTQIPGVSQVLDRSIVTYSNKAKIEEVAVNKKTLEKYGAVSEETANEMAKGLLNKADLDIVLSITGIAGPDGGNADKPVGTVFICTSNGNIYNTVKYNFTGDRESIIRKSIRAAFSQLWKFLLKL